MEKLHLKKIFQSTKEPKINFGLQDASLNAQKSAGKMSISGVQPKLSMSYDRRNNELIVVPERGEYILKPQTQTFPNLPENEQICMDIAEAFGINVPEHGLLSLNDGTLAYVVKRFDRKDGEKLHQENFFQILSAKDKYRGSTESIGKMLQNVSSVPGLDVQLFYEQVILNFLISNGDAHLANYSLSYDVDNKRRLSPAYDIVCSRLVMPNEDVESALSINGKKNKLERADFDALADYLNIHEAIRYEKFSQKFEIMDKIISDGIMDGEIKAKFKALIKERYQRLNLEL